MTSTEAMLYQLKNLKGKPLKQKLEHIITYFWLPIVIIAVLLYCGVSYIVHLATVKETALNVVCLNAFVQPGAGDAYAQSFAEAAGIDLEEYELVMTTDLNITEGDVGTSYETAQVITAQIVAHTLDVMTADLDTLTRYFYQELLEPLDQALTPQQMEAYQDAFLYVDMAVVRQFREADLESIPDFPDPTKPEEMEEPVAIALAVPRDSGLMDTCYPSWKSIVALGLVVNTKNLPNAQAFVDYVME